MKENSYKSEKRNVENNYNALWWPCVFITITDSMLQIRWHWSGMYWLVSNAVTSYCAVAKLVSKAVAKLVSNAVTSHWAVAKLVSNAVAYHCTVKLISNAVTCMSLYTG